MSVVSVKATPTMGLPFVASRSGSTRFSLLTEVLLFVWRSLWCVALQPFKPQRLADLQDLMKWPLFRHPQQSRSLLTTVDFSS